MPHVIKLTSNYYSGMMSLPRIVRVQARRLTIRGSAFKLKVATELHSTTACLSDHVQSRPAPIRSIMLQNENYYTVLTVRV